MARFLGRSVVISIETVAYVVLICLALSFSIDELHRVRQELFGGGQGLLLPQPHGVVVLVR